MRKYVKNKLPRSGLCSAGMISAFLSSKSKFSSVSDILQFMKFYVVHNICFNFLLYCLSRFIKLMKFGKLFPFGYKHFLHNVHICTRTTEKYHGIIYGFGFFNLIFGCKNVVPFLCCKFVQ